MSKEFAETCNKIECSPNFRGDIEDTELFALIRNEDGELKRINCQKAIAIAKPRDIQNWRIYTIKIAQRSFLKFKNERSWCINEGLAIGVDSDGKALVFDSVQAQSGNFTTPLTKQTFEALLKSSIPGDNDIVSLFENKN